MTTRRTSLSALIGLLLTLLVLCALYSPLTILSQYRSQDQQIISLSENITRTNTPTNKTLLQEVNALLAQNKARENTLLVTTLVITLLAASIAFLLWKKIAQPLAAIEAQQDQHNKPPHTLITAILAASPQAIIATDLNGLITQFSRGAEKMLGYTAAEVLHTEEITHLLFDPHELAEKTAKLAKALGLHVAPGFDFFAQQITSPAHNLLDQEHALICKNGKHVTVLLSSFPQYDDNAKLIGYLGIASDISERKRVESQLKERAAELAQQQSLFNALLKSVPAGVLIVEAPSRKPFLINDRAMLTLGMRRDDLRQNYTVHKLPDRIIYPHEELPLTLGMHGINSHVNDMLIVMPDGREHILEATGAPVRDAQGNIWASVTCFIDISERVEETTEMSRLAYLDHLTQLPNRRLFSDRLKMSLSKARRNKNRMALLSIDLDKFKPVNDNLGHAVGDLLLQAVARRMQECLRESDTLARVGGDEFAVILPQIAKDSDALGVAEKIRMTLNDPFDLDGGYNVNIACCIGIAIYPDHGKDEKSLLTRADETMYAAKQAGRNRVTVYADAAPAVSIIDKPLSRITWRKSYLCGNTRIDEGHQQLINDLNAIILALRTEHFSKEATQQLINTLTQHFTEHMTEEEAWLKNYDIPELADHPLKHQKILVTLRELQSKILTEESSAREFVHFFTEHVVHEHILKEDRKFFALLHEKNP